MRLLLLASAALSLALGACTTTGTSSPPVAASAPAGPAAPKADPEASAYGLFLAGQAALDTGDLGDASDYLSRASAAEGGPAFLNEAAFAAALAAGEIDKAAALAPTGPDVDPATRSLGELTQGVEAMAEGRDKDAFARFGSPDLIQPYRSEGELLAPWAAAGMGDKKDATVEPSIGDSVSDFVGALDRAMLFERTGDPAKAETVFKELSAGSEAGGLVSMAYGGFLERHGRWKEAEQLFQTALAHAPGDAELLAAKAAAEKHSRPAPQPSLRAGAGEVLVIGAASMLAQKQQEPALAFIRLGLRLDPSDDEAWVILGDLLAPRDVDGARDAYAHVKAGAPEYVAARGKLAMTFETDGDHEAALKLARETYAGAPSSREAAVLLADLLRSNDQYDESAAVLTKLIDAAQPQADWRLYYLRASAYQEAGDWPKAEADLQAALKQKPEEPELLNFLGYSWIDRGEHLQEALAMVQKAVDASPQSGAMIDSLGWGYYRLGDYKTAVEKLEAAVSLEPGDPDVNNHLGDAYWRVGRKIEATFQWRRVLSLDPDDKLKAEVAAKLASPLGPDAPIGPVTPALVPVPPAEAAARTAQAQ